MSFALIQKCKGETLEFPISAFQLYRVGLYVMLETGQQLNLDRDKDTPKVKNLKSGETMNLQTFIKTHCVGGRHAN
jgi:hypothetical protein